RRSPQAATSSTTATRRQSERKRLCGDVAILCDARNRRGRAATNDRDRTRICPGHIMREETRPPSSAKRGCDSGVPLVYCGPRAGRDGWRSWRRKGRVRETDDGEETEVVARPSGAASSLRKMTRDGLDEDNPRQVRSTPQIPLGVDGPAKGKTRGADHGVR